MNASKSGAASPLKVGLCLIAALVVAIGGLLAIKGSFIKTAAEAYLFGYPLVIIDITRSAKGDLLGAQNELIRGRRLPDPDFRSIVRPNVDTLYSFAFLDLDDGPFVLEMAENKERYTLVPILDGWSNVFASLGTRTNGTAAANYLLVGPKWQGEVPEGLELVRAPTRIAWMLGRTQTNGEADYPTVYRIQDGIRLASLSDWLAHAQTGAAAEAQTTTTPATPAPSSAAPDVPVDLLRQLSAPAFFERLAQLMADNPPADRDAPMMAKLASIGIAPGQAPDWNGLDRLCASIGRKLADLGTAVAMKRKRDLVNGWWTPPMTLGDYGTDYPLRAAVAMAGLGANQPADAIYPTAHLDRDGDALDGSRHYRLHFEADALPPVNAFWSITAYGPDAFLIANEQRRYALRDRDGLTYNPDGSLDLYFGPTLPANAPEHNWLPVKRGEDFQLTARLFWPKESVLAGQWQLPGIEPVD